MPSQFPFSQNKGNSQMVNKHIILLSKALLSNKRPGVSKLNHNTVQKDLPEEQ